MQQDRRLAAAQVIVAADSVNMELTSLLGENREIWFKGLNGEELSETDEMMFQVVAEAHFRRHLGAFQRIQLLGFGTADGIVSAYAFDLYRYSELRRLYLQRSLQAKTVSSYVDGSPSSEVLTSFRSRVDNKLVVIDAASPDKNENPLFPF